MIKVVVKSRVADQVGNGLADIDRRPQSEKFAGGMIPPFQIAVAVDHQDGILQGGSGILNAVDDGLQFLLMLAAALLQPLGFAENRAPDADGAWQWCALALLQPVLQARQLQPLPGGITSQCQC